MGKHIDIGYFKKPIKVRAKVAKERTVINKMYAWRLDKQYYDDYRIKIVQESGAIALQCNSIKIYYCRIRRWIFPSILTCRTFTKWNA